MVERYDNLIGKRVNRSRETHCFLVIMLRRNYIILGMKDESEKHFQEAFEKAQQRGLDQLLFVDLYRLHCNANYYFVGDDLSDFKNQTEKELLKRIGKAENDEIVDMFASIAAESDELFSFELFELVVKGDRYSTLDDGSLNTLLDQRLVPFYKILEAANVVKKFESPIKAFLLSIDTAITFWIAKYER